MTDISQLLNRLQGAVRQAVPGTLDLRLERKLKDDLSFVTHGDLHMNRLITELIYQFDPLATVISEETINQAYDPNQITAVVDPIDGTENFTSGLPEWGVSISVFENDRHLGSLIGCPELNLWLKSGVAIKRHTSRIMALSSSLTTEDIAVYTTGYEYRIMGCCVYNMINVIRGSFLSFENPKGAHSWDILGGLNLALENHLNVTVDGKPYSGEYLPADRKYRFRVWND